MEAFLQGLQSISSGILLRWVKMLGCSVVAVAMGTVGAYATMATKKDAAASKASASVPAGKEEGSKKKAAMKGAEGGSAQETKLAHAKDAKKATTPK